MGMGMGMGMGMSMGMGMGIGMGIATRCFIHEHPSYLPRFWIQSQCIESGCLSEYSSLNGYGIPYILYVYIYIDI